MTNEERNKAIMENPLLDWSKDQIKSALKKHSKKELLIIAMQWRMKTEECRHYYDELMKNVNNPNDDTTTEDIPLESDS
jgi:hypothetical protein